MKKIIFILTLSLITNLSSTEKIEGNCSSSYTDLDYLNITFAKNWDTLGTNYNTISIFSCGIIFDDGWHNAKQLSPPLPYVVDNSNTFSFSSLDAEIMYHSIGSSSLTSNDEYLIELYSMDTTKAIVYGDPKVYSYLTLPDDDIDTLLSRTDFDFPETTFKDMSHEVAFIFNLSESNTFGDSYTQSELDYVSVFDNGSILERIEDVDRSNELVGIKYYSDRNSATYTKFIKPNN